MSKLTLQVMDKNGTIIAQSNGEDFTDLVVMRTYEEGDQILLSSSEKNIHLNWQVDDALGAAFVYITDDVSYIIPFGEKRISYSPKVFSGDRHYLYVEVARSDEVSAYRNLALIRTQARMLRRAGRRSLRRKMRLTVCGLIFPMASGLMLPGELTGRMTRR